MRPAVLVRFLAHPLTWKILAFLALALGAYHTADLRLQSVELRIGVVERDTTRILEIQEKTATKVQEIAERTARMEGARGVSAPAPLAKYRHGPM